MEETLFVQNILGRVGRRAVRVGQMWVPIEQVPDFLARFSKQIFALNSDRDHPYSLLGTATAIRYRGRGVLFCCKHQIKGYDPDDIVIPTDKHGKILVGGTRFIPMPVNDQNRDEEFTDICAFVFDPSKYDVPNFEYGFYDFVERDCWTGSVDSEFILLGYPTRLRNVDYDIPHIALKQVTFRGRYSAASHAVGLHRLQMQRTAQFSTDGMSGGPVFHLGLRDDDHHIGLAGIVMRGSDTSEFIHFMDVQALFSILRFVDTTIAQDG